MDLRNGATPLVGDIAPADLRPAIARAAAAWRKLGVRPGELLLLCIPPSGEETAAFFGALRAGAVPIRCAGLADGAGDSRPPTRFILDTGRGGYPMRWRDSVLTLPEWRKDLAQAGTRLR
jgi:hypothetical protein